MNFEQESINDELIKMISECDANKLKRLILHKLIEEHDKAEYIKSREKDKWFINHRERYELVRKLYDIFTRGDELYQYVRCDIMINAIFNYIESIIEDFDEKYDVMSKCLSLEQITLLALCDDDFTDDELYKMCQALSDNNKHKVKPRIINNRYKMCEYIATYLFKCIYG